MPVLMGALLCDAAHDYNGLVSVLGGFVSILNVNRLPAAAPVTFAARVGFNTQELGTSHEINVVVIAPGGEQIADIRAVVALSPNAVIEHEDLAQGINLVIPIPFAIQVVGTYRVELGIDGDVPMVSLPLKVVIQAPPG